MIRGRRLLILDWQQEYISTLQRGKFHRKMWFLLLGPLWKFFVETHQSLNIATFGHLEFSCGRFFIWALLFLSATKKILRKSLNSCKGGNDWANHPYVQNMSMKSCLSAGMKTIYVGRHSISWKLSWRKLNQNQKRKQHRILASK